MIIVLWILAAFILIWVVVSLDVEYNSGWINSAATVVILAGFYFGSVWLFKVAENSCKDDSYTVDLYSGTNDKVISGHFALGSGSIDTIDQVEYWIKNGEVLRKYTAPMGQSSFIEDGKNFVKYEKKKCSLDWLVPMGSGRIQSFIFHVPEDSVARMYEFQ